MGIGRLICATRWRSVAFLFWPMGLFSLFLTWVRGRVFGLTKWSFEIFQNDGWVCIDLTAERDFGLECI